MVRDNIEDEIVLSRRPCNDSGPFRPKKNSAHNQFGLLPGLRNAEKDRISVNICRFTDLVICQTTDICCLKCYSTK